MKLTAQEIVEKEFKKSMKGYNVDDVDTYLNDIIEDYENFEKQLQELREENERLKQELSGSQVRKPAPQLQTSTTNFDILQRLSNLEKHVFGSKLSE